MTPVQIKLAVAGGLLLIAWLWPKAQPAPAATPIATSTLEIDANVYSPTFGEPLGPVVINQNPALDPTMRKLIDQSNAAIAADDALNPLPQSGGY